LDRYLTATIQIVSQPIKHTQICITTSQTHDIILVIYLHYVHIYIDQVTMKMKFSLNLV